MRFNFLSKTLLLFLLLDLFPSSFSRKLFPGNILREKSVLLELKRSFSDPSGILSSWDPDNYDHCSWFGISCDSKSRVVSVIVRGCDGRRGSSHSPDLSSCSGGNGRLRGKISPAVGKLAEIRVLSLAFNDLGGEIPEEIWGLEKLEVLLLQGNNLIWKLPENFSGLKKIRVLDLGLNQTSEEIKSKSGNGVRSLILLEEVKMYKDSLSGHTFLKLRRLMADDGDQNSQNDMGSNSPGGNGLYPIEIASIVSASVIVFVLFVLVILFFYTRKWKGKSQVRIAEAKEIRVFVDDFDGQLTYDNIVRATGYFSNSNCIGHGGFGSTYRAEVSPDTVLAVKRLSVGRFQGVQQFHAEIKTLELVRHPNLVRLIGYHASETEMFLIYNYLPGGNLEDFIKERSKAALEWKTLHKIALDVARALAYLHEECNPKVLHRDIKPSNILLDNNFKAYLSDFGLSKLLGSSQSHVTTGVAGTFGYVAPEYAMTCRVSEKADVYSYGVVILELISDKKALDPSFSSHENGFNIVSWAHMMLRQGKAKDVFTRGLWESSPPDDLVEFLHLALKCTVESLSTRPTMKQVVQQLKKIRPPS